MISIISLPIPWMQRGRRLNALPAMNLQLTAHNVMKVWGGRSGTEGLTGSRVGEEFMLNWAGRTLSGVLPAMTYPVVTLHAGLATLKSSF
jgi:hypothetical protein